jgi:hypothetical protein
VRPSASETGRQKSRIVRWSSASTSETVFTGASVMPRAMPPAKRSALLYFRVNSSILSRSAGSGIARGRRGEHARLVGAPVLLSGPRLVDDTRLDHPRDQRQKRRGGGDQRHLTIGARVDERRHERCELQPGAVALDVLALDRVGGHRVEAGPEHRGLHGDVHELRLARVQRALVRDERRECALHGRVIPRLWDCYADRPAVRLSEQRHHAAHRGEREVGREVVRIRPALPERTDRHVHQIRSRLA